MASRFVGDGVTCNKIGKLYVALPAVVIRHSIMGFVGDGVTCNKIGKL